MKPNRVSWVLSRYVVGKQRMEGIDHWQDHLQNAHAPDGIGQIGVAASQVETYRNVEFACLLVEGEEVGVAGGSATTLPALLQDSAGPVFFDECHLL